MAELIEKSAVLTKIDEFAELNKAHGFPVDIFDMEMLKKIIENIPAAEVAQVKHGEWFGTVCTACGESTSFYYDCNYCPWCGAKMDGEKEG